MNTDQKYVPVRYSATHSEQTEPTTAGSAPKVYERVRTQPINNSGEIWKAIPNLGDRFEVSNLGKIRSQPRSYVPNIGVGHPSGKFLKTAICNKGYERIVVLWQGEKISLLINRVVAIAFVPNPHNLLYVRHKDTNKLNNRADNLEWTAERQKTTRKEGKSHV